MKYELRRDDGSQLSAFDGLVFDSMDALRSFVRKLNAELRFDCGRQLIQEGLDVREIPDEYSRLAD
jgi:hypothetical protein